MPTVNIWNNGRILSSRKLSFQGLETVEDLWRHLDLGDSAYAGAALMFRGEALKRHKLLEAYDIPDSGIVNIIQGSTVETIASATAPSQAPDIIQARGFLTVLLFPDTIHVTRSLMGNRNVLDSLVSIVPELRTDLVAMAFLEDRSLRMFRWLLTAKRDEAVGFLEKHPAVFTGLSFLSAAVFEEKSSTTSGRGAAGASTAPGAFSLDQMSDGDDDDDHEDDEDDEDDGEVAANAEDGVDEVDGAAVDQHSGELMDVDRGAGWSGQARHPIVSSNQLAAALATLIPAGASANSAPEPPVPESQRPPAAAAAAAAHSIDPEFLRQTLADQALTQYASQLEILRGMGIYDQSRALRALMLTSGDVEQALGWIFAAQEVDSD